MGRYSLKIGIILILSLALSTSGRASELSEDAQFSIITCTPGAELYARYGHTALRVADHKNDIDLTFNYGTFDFNTEHFYWKFVRGETWYELSVTPTWWFNRMYSAEGRIVYEQVLHLDPTERAELWSALENNYRPENRRYLYNFVFDNCATRPYHLIASSVGGLTSSYEGYRGVSYRRFLRRYTGMHSWANAGINLLFGRKADQPMDDLDRLFLPEELMLYLSQSHKADGEKLTSLPTDFSPFEQIKTPWYASWECGLVFYFLIVLAFSCFDRKRHTWSWGVELAAGIPYGLLLIIVTFLTFFSCHPLVGFGWRLLIIPLTHLCARTISFIRL